MMEGIRTFSSTDRSSQLQSITIMLLQEYHITTFTQTAGAVLEDIVHTAKMKNKQLHLTSKSNCQLQQQQAGTVMMKYNWINQLGGCYHLHQYQMGTLTMTSWILLNQRGKRYHLQQYQMGKVMILLMQICTLVRSHQHHTGSRIWSFVSRTKNSWQRGPG